MEDTQQEDEIWKRKAPSEREEGPRGPRLGTGASVTLCDEDGVLQVGQQWVLVVTLVPEKDQEPGEREGASELGPT